MNLLILTQYYPPEIGAPQNRLSELAERLQNKDINVTVLTAMPNYPKMELMRAYKGKLFCKEEVNNVTVFRSWIFVIKSKSIISRLLNYFSFVVSSFIVGIFKVRKHDYIFCESPPLFLGISAYYLCLIKGSRLIFNVSDLWPESAEKLNIINNKYLLGLATQLEEFLYRKSILITGQTQGIVNNIKSRLPEKNVYWLKNGVDVNFYKPNTSSSGWRQKNGFRVNDFLLLYAGILGHAQGLKVILHAADKLRNYDHIKFIFLGTGPEKDKLLKVKVDLQLRNVYFMEPVPKKQISEVILDIDASVIPLKKLDLFKGAIPSKIFEVLALSKPILLGVEGEAQDLFIEEGKAGLAFEPENSNDLADKILVLLNNPLLSKEMGNNGRRYVTENFNRDIIAEEFYSILHSLK